MRFVRPQKQLIVRRQPNQVRLRKNSHGRCNLRIFCLVCQCCREWDRTVMIQKPSWRTSRQDWSLTIIGCGLIVTGWACLRTSDMAATSKRPRDEWRSSLITLRLLGLLLPLRMARSIPGCLPARRLPRRRRRGRRPSN